MGYHKSVLFDEALDALNIKEDGTYVDVTFGGGGHSRGILERLGENGKLFGFDQDPDAEANVPDDPRFKFVKSNFQFLKNFLRLNRTRKVDGILADLGVSSHQFDKAERGFSYRFAADLDMRMNYRDGKTAADVVNEYSAEDLQRIFGEYGEVRNSKTLAEAIVAARFGKKIKTNGDFLSVIDPYIRGQKMRYLSQVYQALRIEVNDEMGVLEAFLKQVSDVLAPDGRVVIISFHSLEDRLVKNFFKTGNIKGELERDFYGNITRPFKIITKKPVVASDEELKANVRSRSAKMRVAEVAKDKK